MKWIFWGNLPNNQHIYYPPEQVILFHWNNIIFCLQSMRLKIISAAGSAERRFSSWIGGSILASLVSIMKKWLGSFQQKQNFVGLYRMCVLKFSRLCPLLTLAGHKNWLSGLNIESYIHTQSCTAEILLKMLDPINQSMFIVINRYKYIVYTVCFLC